MNQLDLKGHTSLTKGGWGGQGEGKKGCGGCLTVLRYDRAGPWFQIALLPEMGGGTGRCEASFLVREIRKPYVHLIQQLGMQHVFVRQILSTKKPCGWISAGQVYIEVCG